MSTSSIQLNLENRAYKIDNSLMDITLKCQDCGNEFIFTEDEQRFYRSKGLDQPQYCLICRAKHRAEQKDPGRLAKLKIEN